MLQLLSLATSTQHTSLSQCRTFTRFCELFNFPSFPTQLDILVLFVAYESLVHRHSIDSTRNVLSAVRREHLQAGFKLPTPSDFFPLQEAVQGARRFLARQVIQKLPLCPKLLSFLLATSNWGVYYEVLVSHTMANPFKTLLSHSYWG